MSDSPGDGKASHPANQPEAKNEPANVDRTGSEAALPGSESANAANPSPATARKDHLSEPKVQAMAPLVMVETAFLASTSSLIWLINYYFPTGPLLQIFYPVPIALVYLRWGNRAAWMSALVSGLLLSVLMGPTRSILFLIPYGLLGVVLGALWRRRAAWPVSIGIGTLLASLGFFFKIWLVSILLGDDLWLYITSQITRVVEWAVIKLGLLIQPDLSLIQAIAVLLVIVNNTVYLFVVHLAAWLLLERLGNPIPAPPHWVQVILDYEGE